MVANAPVTIFRAGAKMWEFTAVALTLQAGMTIPRLAGLVVAGVTGCFAVLLAWYAALVFMFARPIDALPPEAETHPELVARGVSAFCVQCGFGSFISRQTAGSQRFLTDAGRAWVFCLRRKPRLCRVLASFRRLRRFITRNFSRASC